MIEFQILKRTKAALVLGVVWSGSGHEKLQYTDRPEFPQRAHRKCKNSIEYLVPSCEQTHGSSTRDRKNPHLCWPGIFIFVLAPFRPDIRSENHMRTVD